MECSKKKIISVTQRLWQVVVLLDLLLDGPFLTTLHHAMHLQLGMCKLNMQVSMLLGSIFVSLGA